MLFDRIIFKFIIKVKIKKLFYNYWSVSQSVSQPISQSVCLCLSVCLSLSVCSWYRNPSETHQQIEFIVSIMLSISLQALSLT